MIKLLEELWPKKYSEEIGKKFETEIVMKSRVRDWMAAEHPTEYQLKDIPENVTWGDVIETLKKGGTIPSDLDFHLDTEPREFIWQRACELYYLQTGEFLDSDFERVYNEKRTDLQTAEEKVEGEEELKANIQDGETPMPTPEEENPFELDWE